MQLKLFEQYERVIRYLFAGGLAALVNLVLLYLLTDILGVWYLASAVLAFILSFFAGFFLQKIWTFADGGKAGVYRQMTGYLLVALLNLFINTALMYLLVDGLKLWYLLAQFIASGLVAIESYYIYKAFIFNRNANGRNVLIATGIYPPDYRGPATMLEALPQALEANGFTVKVITYSKVSSTSAEKGKVYRVSRNLPALIRYLKYFFLMFYLSGWSNVIYTTDIYSVGYFSYLIKQLTGRRYLIRFAGDSAWETAVRRGWTSDSLEDFLKKTYSHKIEKLKLRRKKIMVKADAVIAVSNFLARIAKAIGASSEKIKVIYNSIDFVKDNVDEALIREIRKPYGQQAKIIVAAGELNPWKGFDGIIKATPILVKELGEAHLLILGEGQEEENLRHLAARLGAASYVHLLCRISHDRIMNYFRAADLFILNSNYEGLSHTLLEVMKAGVPIIASNLPANQEVIASGRDGLLVSYNNISELAEAALKILKNNELAGTFRKNAMEKLRLFSWQKVVAETVALLNKII